MEKKTRPSCVNIIIWNKALLLSSQIGLAILGRCTKVPESARGLRKQPRRWDRLPDSAVSGRPPLGLIHPHHAPIPLHPSLVAVTHLCTAFGAVAMVLFSSADRWALTPSLLPHLPPPGHTSKAVFLLSAPKIKTQRGL